MPYTATGWTYGGVAKKSQAAQKYMSEYHQNAFNDGDNKIVLIPIRLLGLRAT